MHCCGRDHVFQLLLVNFNNLIALLSPNGVAKWVSLLIRSREDPSTNLCPEINYPGKSFPWISSVCPGKFQDTALIRPRPLTFILFQIHEKLFYYLTLYKLSHWATVGHHKPFDRTICNAYQPPINLIGTGFQQNDHFVIYLKVPEFCNLLHSGCAIHNNLLVSLWTLTLQHNRALVIRTNWNRRSNELKKLISKLYTYVMLVHFLLSKYTYFCFNTVNIN